MAVPMEFDAETEKAAAEYLATLKLVPCAPEITFSADVVDAAYAKIRAETPVAASAKTVAVAATATASTSAPEIVFSADVVEAAYAKIRAETRAAANTVI